MRRAFVNGRVLTPDGWFDGGLLVEAGRVTALLAHTAAPPAGSDVVDAGGRLILPGFVDTQVNGGGGVLFNDAPDVDGIAAIGAAHARFGTTTFLPTLISDGPDVLRRALDAVDRAIAEGVPGVAGIHVEGPFLASARRGIHAAERLRELDEESLALLTAPRRGVTLLTLAPERVAPAQLTRLHAAGVVLAAGHTEATATDIESALRHGLSAFTHLYNAMTPTTAREPGVVGAALADQESYCGIIVDGRHVDPRVLRLALRTKRHDRFMLVTDAMPCVGTQQRQFDLHGRRIHVEDGWCVDDAGTLAGTALDMASTVRNAVNLLELPLEAASRMASEYPARFLGLVPERGILAVGSAADFVLTDHALAEPETWIGGIRTV